jgi:hypothetical protein
MINSLDRLSQPHSRVVISRRVVKSAIVLFLILTCCSCYGKSNVPTDGRLRSFLQSYLKTRGVSAKLSHFYDSTTRYSYATFHLSETAEAQIIVYVTGRGWCGTGGCTLLILNPKGSSYDVVGRITIVLLPVEVLRSTTNGWHDIAVRAKGVSMGHQFTAVLKFNGGKYSGSPWETGTRFPIESQLKGTTLSLTRDGKLLYPQSGK